MNILKDISVKNTSCKYCIARQAYIDGIVAMATLELEDAMKKADALGLRRE